MEQHVEPGVTYDPATRLFFAECACGWDAACISLGTSWPRRRGARGVLDAHREECRPQGQRAARAIAEALGRRAA